MGVGVGSNLVPRAFPFHPFFKGKALGPVSRKPRKLFGPEKPFVKIRLAYSLKLVFSYVVKGLKIKITAKSRASRRLSFKATKRIVSPEIRPKSFGTFEKQAPVKVPLQHMKRPALQNKQFVVLRLAFRARKVLGTFEKRAPGDEAACQLLKYKCHASQTLFLFNIVSIGFRPPC